MPLEIRQLKHHEGGGRGVNKYGTTSKPSCFLCLLLNVFVVGVIVRYKSFSLPKLAAPADIRVLFAGPTTASGSTIDNSSSETSSITTSKKLLQLMPCERLGQSQRNQDCILDKIFDAIGTTNKEFVEYGFNTNHQCSNSGPNTCRLWKYHNWTGVLLDGSHSNPDINLHAHFLYSNNMVAILEKYKVLKEVDFYSGDMDSHDYFIMKTVLDSGMYRPRVITTEYNSNYPLSWAISEVDPTIAYPDQVPAPYQFQQCTWGASPEAFKFLMEKYGYKMVAVSWKLDLFWIRGDILDELGYEVPSYESLMDGVNLEPNHRPKSDASFLSKLVDVKVYERTKSVRLANRAIVQTILNHVTSTTEETIPCLRNVAPEQIAQYLREHPPIGGHLNLG